MSLEPIMLRSSLHIDITELVANPLRTGIQRVEREIIHNWPGPAHLTPCRFDSATQRFVQLPEAVLAILGSDTATSVDAEKELLRPHLIENVPLLADELSFGLFNPEVFFDPLRADAYRALCRHPKANVSWLIYDFLPFLRPQDYHPGTPKSCMPYIQAVRDIPRVAFISERTQIEYTTRIVRDSRRTGPYFPLGGDGLQMEKQEFSLSKKLFAYIGTIEPRKNVAVILEGFEKLWARGVDVELILIGRMDSRSTREPPILRRHVGEARLNYLGHTNDATIREVMRQVRATLFISSAEGFGIPPYESLSAGIPVIVSQGLPSIELLPPGGRITLDTISPEAVAAAVEATLDNRNAARLWHEAARLVIPTWNDFVRSVAAWLQEWPPASQESSTSLL